jgi:hypothetical protein
MNLTHALCHELGIPPVLDGRPIVFVVDDDISVRESLELLIRCEGWQPETFASAKNSLPVHELSFRAAWCWIFHFQDSMVSNCRTACRCRTRRHADHLHHGLR